MYVHMYMYMYTHSKSISYYCYACCAVLPGKGPGLPMVICTTPESSAGLTRGPDVEEQTALTDPLAAAYQHHTLNSSVQPRHIADS